MPVYEPPKKGWGWGHYVAVGCGGCLVLAVLVPMVLGFIFSFAAARKMGSMASSTPPKHNGRYHYSAWSASATAKITLPDSHGTLTYGHLLPQGAGGGGGGIRGLKLAAPNGSTQEWPLPDSGAWPVNVEVYWHPAKAGKGPFVRFKDPVDECVLDLGRREVGAVCRSGSKAFMADYAYNDNEFHSAIIPSTSSAGVPDGYLSANGKPAADVTAALASSNCTQLGSIVQNGGKLVFQPAQAKRP